MDLVRVGLACLLVCLARAYILTHDLHERAAALELHVSHPIVGTRCEDPGAPRPVIVFVSAFGFEVGEEGGARRWAGSLRDVVRALDELREQRPERWAAHVVLSDGVHTERLAAVVDVLVGAHWHADVVLDSSGAPEPAEARRRRRARRCAPSRAPPGARARGSR